MDPNPPGRLVRQRRTRRAAALCAPVLVACLAFAPALRNGFVWDDRMLILENPALSEPGAAWKAFGRDYWSGIRASGAADYYRPLAFVSLAGDRALHGAAPRGYHATNIVLHAAVALLLALLLLELGAGALPAGLGAALFAAHPALTEAVAWISGRTDPLAAFFVLAMLVADRRRAHVAWRAAAFATCAAALCAKESAAVAPLLATLMDIHGGRGLWAALRRRVELWGLLAAYFVVRHQVLGAAGTSDPIVEGGLSIATRVVGLLHLPGILLVPATTRLLYGAGLQPGTLALGGAAGCALIAALAVVVWRRRHAVRPDLPPLFVWLGAVSMLPAAGAVILLSGLADRLVYLPAVFLLPACALAAFRWLPRRVAAAALSIAVAGSAAAAASRARLWRDDHTFFTQAAAEADAAAPAHYNLAIALHQEGRLRECDAALEAALAQAPLPGAFFLRGLLYYEIGCEDLALQFYGQALAHDPGFADAGNNLAALYLDRGDFDAARRVYGDLAQRAQPAARRVEFSRALQSVEAARAQPAFRPQIGAECGTPAAAAPLLQDAPALNRRGLELLRRRQLESAHIALTAALRIAPGLPDAQLNLAQYHMLSGTPERARELLLEVQRRNPGDPRAARLLQELGPGGR